MAEVVSAHDRRMEELLTEAGSLAKNFKIDRTPSANQIEYFDQLLPGIQETIGTTHNKFSLILDAVLGHQKLIDDFGTAGIRRTTMQGKVFKDFLRHFQMDEENEETGVMAIGDVDVPDFMIPVFQEFLVRRYIWDTKILARNGVGYDTMGQGDFLARTKSIDYFDKFYKFSDYEDPNPEKPDKPKRKEALSKNFTITPGGMHSLNIIAKSLADDSASHDKKQRFVIPVGPSFGTWKDAIATTMANIGKNGTVEKKTFKTKQENLLQPTEEDVENFYKKNPVDSKVDDTWYITPVGNPSGTSMTPEQLKGTCEAIVRINPNAVIILDCVYVRTMGEKESQKLMNGVVSNKKIMDRAVFVESFSKTHGVTGLRSGMFFSANDKIYEKVRAKDNAEYAGHGPSPAAIAMACIETEEEHEEEYQKWYEFWRREREGLYNKLIKSGEFTDLFHENQCHITEDQLKRPINLYLFLRLKEGVTQKRIIERTKGIGVTESVEEGPGEEKDPYVRFSVGTLIEPKFSKYAEAA